MLLQSLQTPKYTYLLLQRDTLPLIQPSDGRFEHKIESKHILKTDKTYDLGEQALNIQKVDAEVLRTQCPKVRLTSHLSIPLKLTQRVADHEGDVFGPHVVVPVDVIARRVIPLRRSTHRVSRPLRPTHKKRQHGHYHHHCACPSTASSLHHPPGHSYLQQTVTACTWKLSQLALSLPVYPLLPSSLQHHRSSYLTDTTTHSTPFDSQVSSATLAAAGK